MLPNTEAEERKRDSTCKKLEVLLCGDVSNHLIPNLRRGLPVNAFNLIKPQVNIIVREVDEKT